VETGASSLVVTGEADLLFWEEDESGSVLNLAQWGQVVVQIGFGTIFGGHVWHHVRLQLQVPVMTLDDDNLEEVSRYGNFTLSQDIKFHDCLSIVTTW